MRSVKGDVPTYTSEQVILKVELCIGLLCDDVKDLALQLVCAVADGLHQIFTFLASSTI
jgi:hypothetical protein